MKKMFKLIAGAVICMSLVSATAYAETKNIAITVNGSILNAAQSPYIENNRTMVPMRAIFEALDANVDYDADTKTAIAIKGGTTVSISANSQNMFVNNESIYLDSVAVIKNGSMMVPLRAISEAFGARVDWDSKSNSVNISLYGVEDDKNTQGYNSEDAYNNIITNADYKSSVEGTTVYFSNYALYDIDKDGKDELFLLYYSDESTDGFNYGIVKVYTFKNGNAVYCGDLNQTGFYFTPQKTLMEYPLDNGVFVRCIEDIHAYNRVTLTGNKLEITGEDIDKHSSGTFLSTLEANAGKWGITFPSDPNNDKLIQKAMDEAGKVFPDISVVSVK